MHKILAEIAEFIEVVQRCTIKDQQTSSVLEKGNHSCSHVFLGC